MPCITPFSLEEPKVWKLSNITTAPDSAVQAVRVYSRLCQIKVLARLGTNLGGGKTFYNLNNTTYTLFVEAAR